MVEGVKKNEQLIHGMIVPNRRIAAALMLVDRVGGVFRRRRPKPVRIDSVLLVFFGSFGDGLLFTSVLRSLREQMPPVRIDVLASKDVGAVLAGNPHVSRLIVTDMPSGREYPSRVPGLYRLMKGLVKGSGVRYDAALCLRGPLDNGLVPLFLSGISRYNIGFTTGGFSFCLDEVVPYRSGIHETEHFLDLLHVICPECRVGEQELFYDAEAVRRSLDAKLAGLGLAGLGLTGSEPGTAGAGAFVIVHPGSKVMKRSLSLERWRTILTELLEQTEKTVLVTGIESERSFYEAIGVFHPRIVPTLGVFSIPELAELIRRAGGVVTVETFVSHLAGWSGVPSLAFWTGVTDVRQWRPLGSNVAVRSVMPPCAPCFRWCEDPVCMEHDVALVTEILAAR